MEPIYETDKMGNWHQDVQVTKDLKTSQLSDPYNGKSFVSQLYIADLMQSIFGDSLKEKTVLDTACNAGGSLYSLQSVGIKKGFGFDIRQSWIDQAEWLKKNINLYSTKNLSFECGGFELIDKKKTYDVSLFNGIFYHLTNPILELSKVASVTNDVIMVNTAYDVRCQETRPCLVYKMEGSAIEEGLTGVEGISWLPNSEQLIINVLKKLGFVNVKLLFKQPEVNRLCVIASKITSLQL